MLSKKEAIREIDKTNADYIHVDIMDGVFVKNKNYTPSEIIKLVGDAKKPLDVHLMIEKPERYIETFAEVGADIITVHYESTVHLHRTLRQIKATGCKAGVVLNLTTPVSVLEDILSECYMVLIMSINPGFGGQKFEEITYQKVKKLRKMIDDQGLNTLIEIDGGVTNKNAVQLVEAGANVLVAGSYVFGAENPITTIAELKKMTKV